MLRYPKTNWEEALNMDYKRNFALKRAGEAKA